MLNCIPCFVPEPLKPICMRNHNSHTFSCDNHLWERLCKTYPDSTHQRSAFVAKCIKEGLDKEDVEVQISLKKDKWFNDRIVPEVRNIVKKYDYGHILEMWGGSSSMRDGVRKEMTSTVNDDDLKRALSEVLKDYE